MNIGLCVRSRKKNDKKSHTILHFSMVAKSTQYEVGIMVHMIHNVQKLSPIDRLIVDPDTNYLFARINIFWRQIKIFIWLSYTNMMENG